MLRPQQILPERYQFRDCLGQNIGRETWLAMDLQTGAPVVVKLLTLSWSFNSGYKFYCSANGVWLT
jgi:hypothetical protein